MRKIFLYLYPIEEFNKIFLFDDSFYKEMNRNKPFPILDECIEKRYRDKGYEVIYALYPNKNIYGITPKVGDKVIYTDVTFEQATYNSQKQNNDIIYPSEKYLIDQLGLFDEIIVGGFHYKDCVKRVAEYCYQMGISTLVDLDLTDLFFALYYDKKYFKIDEYDPERYKMYFLKNSRIGNEEMAENLFNRNYNSPIYGFEQTTKIIK